MFAATKLLQSLRAQMMNSPEQQPALVETAPSANQQSCSPDITWQVLAAHWFLICIGGWVRQGFVRLPYTDFLDRPMLSEYFTYVGASPTAAAGSAFAVAVMAVVPIAVLYILAPNKPKLKVKLYYAVAGWCVLAIQFYPVARQFLASSD